MKNFVLLFLFVGFSVSLSAQNTGSKEVSGTITNLNEPLKDVNILVKGTFNGTRTNDLGEYNIKVNVGDQLEYRHVGYEIITIIIEDVTSILNIEMDNYVTKLDEVVIDATAKTRKSVAGDEYNRKIKSSLGNINPMLMDGARYFSRKRLATQYRTLSDALKFYYPKGLPSKNFDLDGTYFEGEPFVDMSTVRDVYFVPKYPSAKLDPLDKSLIIIRTTNSEEYREITAEKHRNQNYYDNNALASENATTFSSSDLTRDLSGIVTHLLAPIPNANITIKGTSKGTKTNEKGEYSLKANVGDVIAYSHLNYTTVEVMVDDATSTLNIELQEKENELNEIVVKTKRSPKDLATFEEKMNAEIRTSFGIFRPKAAATKVHYLSGEELGNQYDNLPQALSGKFSGKLPRTYDVDGLPYNSTQISLLSLLNIKDVYVTKNVIVVRTIDAPEEIARQKEEKAEQYRNQDYYKADAVSTTNDATFSSNELTKAISGKVTHLSAPVHNVNITIKGTSKGTKTDTQGAYNIAANVGDILEYSHVKFQTVAVIIEDVTTTLNIELQEKDNALDEVVVKARVDQKALELQKHRAKITQTAVGDINLEATGFAFSYVTGDDLPTHCDGVRDDIRPLECAAAQEFPFMNRSPKPLKWDIDGMIMDRPSFIPISIVENMWFFNNAPAGYGPYRVIIVQTISGTTEAERKKDIAKQYQNQNYYNADAVSSTDETTFFSASINVSQPNFVVSKEINGKVTYLDAPLPLVNIKVVGRNSGVVSSPDGSYHITANVGDIIQFSHLGYATISIVVEDITEVLNIEMVLQENELETIVLTSDGKQGATAEHAKKREESFKTSMGNIDPKTAGYSVGYINGEDITAGARDLYDVLGGKIAGVTVNPVTKEIKLRSTGSINTDVPPIFDVDGVVVTYVPQVAPEDIKDIHVLKSLASTTRYGSQARGGVIVISTKSGNYKASSSNVSKIAEQYTNKDYYNNDASQIALGSLNANVYADTLATFPNKQKAFIYYDETLKAQLKHYSDHISIAQKFLTHFKAPNLTTHILNYLANKHQNNAEILKAVAYQYQTIGGTREAVEIYKAVVKLRPNYAQSYRDLANAYKENNQFKSAWRLYMYYIDQGNDLSSDDIGEMMYNEMEYLYYNRSNQTAIKQKFVPKSESLSEFQNDMRFVFEWNTSEAEFDLEFVSPDLRSYSFEHSLTANQELITEEKEKGFSSKAFFINDLGDGEWLINITYKGNKKDAPTYFKVTKFINWGKPNQTQETAIYRFKNEREKIQLMALNKQQLQVSK